MDWKAMAFLGAYHGINPGMGWLFAVALGLQQGSARGVWRALPPIATGHAAAVGAVVAIAGVVRLVIPIDALKVLVAAMLIALGLYRLWHHRHPRFGGMQVGFSDLTAWSFLMASAHGGGFMLLPFLMDAPLAGGAGHAHAAHMAAASARTPWPGAMAVGVHTLAYLIVMTLTAWLVYRKLGLSLLRKAWFNMDSLWAAALVVTGSVVMFR